jgi:uncharacterized protein YkwD
MRSPAVLAAALLTTLALPLGVAQASPAARPPATSTSRPMAKAAKVRPRSDAWEAKVVALTNARRKAHGLKPLRAASCPDHFAEPWTRHMATTRRLVHQSLDPFFHCPRTSAAGENIAYGYETPRALVSAWMHSAGHRANILSRHFHRIGVAGWRATNGQTYATQDFIG